MSLSHLLLLLRPQVRCPVLYADRCLTGYPDDATSSAAVIELIVTELRVPAGVSPSPDAVIDGSLEVAQP